MAQKMRIWKHFYCWYIQSCFIPDPSFEEKYINLSGILDIFFSILNILLQFTRVEILLCGPQLNYVINKFIFVTVFNKTHNLTLSLSKLGHYSRQNELPEGEIIWHTKKGP